MAKRKAQDNIDIDNKCDNFNVNLLDSFQNKKFKTDDKWISGTTIANYLNGEPLLDWLNLYYDTYEFNNKRLTRSLTKKINKKNINNRNSKNIITNGSFINGTNPTNTLMNNGLLFEKTIYNKLKEKFINDMLLINESNTINFEEDFKKTVNAINNKVPIIAQAVLIDNKTRMRGIADLLVRSDYINKIFSRKVLDKSEYKKNNKLYYVVIDIKWTSMTLCVDGETIRNEGRFKAYKGQLFIYNYILGKIQNYTPSCAYIMAKNWKIDKKNDPQEGFSCFDLAGIINYSNKDNVFIKKTHDAINWIWNVRDNGLCYTPIDPTIKELCVNNSNQNDYPWSDVKKTLIKNTKDITAVWQLTQNHRDKVFDKNNDLFKKSIRRWDDENCTTKNLGFVDSKKSRVIDKILEINRQNTFKILPNSCKDIKDNRLDWKHKYPTDFYIDFETISEQLGNLQNIDVEDSRMNTQIIFMIGVGYEYNDAFHYKVFRMNNFSLNEEKRILIEFKDFLDNLTRDLDEDNKYFPRLFHWSHAEKSMIESAFKRHPSLVRMWKNHHEWIDLCDIFITEPIVVKGSLTFKLKEVANAMFSHGLITTYWDTTEVSDGLSAMSDGINYYSKINKTEDEEKNMNSIVNYNRIDCRALWDILKCIREL